MPSEDVKNESSDVQSAQKQHFNRIATLYEAHYDDKHSAAYRERFIYRPLFEGVNLNGAKVLEAMCGSGQATRRLIESGAHVTGLDISDAQIESFRKRWPECDAVCASILDSGFEDCSFDAVVVIAGLHHITELCVQAVDEIHRILKPGGYFLFMEPHAGSLPDVIRQLWYSKDAMFGEGEKAIDLDSLKKSFSGEFGFELEKYIGNVAYMLILNSMVFRIPLWLKPLYSPLLMPIESLISIAQSKKLSCVSLSRWRKL